MNGLTYLTLVELILPNAPDRGLVVLYRLLKDRSHRLLRGEFGGGDRGCVLHHLGRFHPECRDSKDPGVEFLRRYGGKRFIHDWDRRSLSRDELLRVVRSEIRRRRRERRGVES